MKILGIDPGSSRMGFGIIEYSPALRLIECGVAENKEKALAQKLSAVSISLQGLIEKHRPDCASLEKIFFSKNQKTAIEVAQARGVILYLLTKNNIPVIEFGPQEVKMLITGYGLSDKKAVASMVKKILGIQEIKGYDDVSDALAIAIAAANPLTIKGLTDKGTAI